MGKSVGWWEGWKLEGSELRGEEMCVDNLIVILEFVYKF